jgi:membrane fusion protein, cation efflux system
LYRRREIHFDLTHASFWLCGLEDCALPRLTSFSGITPYAIRAEKHYGIARFYPYPISEKSLFMKVLPIIGSMLAVSLSLGAPAFAHVGHGDEFQAQGGVQRVKVNATHDGLLGITVTPIAQASGSEVMVPVTALVEADGKKLVFVQFGEFYEPVPVTTGATKGDLIAVTQGLTVGEKLVTQGSLSLYAESRKTQANPAAPSPAAPAADAAHTQAHATGAAHSHDHAGGMPMKKYIAVVGGLGLLGSGAWVWASRRKKGV